MANPYNIRFVFTKYMYLLIASHMYSLIASCMYPLIASSMYPLISEAPVYSVFISLFDHR